MMPLASSPCASADVSNLSITIADETPLMDGVAFVMVQGMFHTIRFNVGQGSALTIMLHEGGSPPSTKNVSNYYEFEYTSAGGFKDKSYGQFIDPSKCSRDVGSAKFYVAVDPSVSIAGWTLRIDVDGIPELSASVSMKRMTVGLALSQPEFVFRVDPFTPKNTTSEQSFNTENQGNVPVGYSMKLDKLSVMIAVSSMDGTVHRGEKRSHTVSATVPRYSPQKIDVKGTLKAEVPKTLLKLTGTVALQTVIEQVIDIHIIIAHPGYDVVNLGDGKVVIQYEKSRIAKYGDVLTLRTYYTGRIGVELKLTASDLEVKDTRLNYNSSSPPLVFPLSESAEQIVDVVVTPVKDDVSAIMKYHIESSDGTIVYDLTTTVAVSASPIPYGQEPLPMLSIAGLAFVLGVILLIIAFLVVSRRRESRSQRRSKKGKRKPVKKDDDATPTKGLAASQGKTRKEPEKVTIKKKRIDPKRQRKLERRRKRWLESHEKKVRRRSLKR
jgi:hypothetical protein